MTAKYSWVTGFRNHGVDATDAAQELERIRTAQGKLTAEIVVRESSAESSPLHNVFVWDDARAAHLYRSQQANALIRCLVVADENVDEPQHRVYVLTRCNGEDGTYEPMSVVVTDSALLADAVDHLKRELISAQRSLSEIKRLADRHAQGDKRLFAMLDATQKGLGRAVSGIEKYQPS